MKELIDIFSGAPDKDPMWLETVDGLSKARERMEQLAAKAPGRYFLFSTAAEAVLAETETFERRDSLGRAS